MSTTVTTEQNARMRQISSKLVALSAELESLQTRALPVVEELENDFYRVPLSPEVKAMLLTMRKLITKVG